MLVVAGHAGKLATALRVADERGVAVPLLNQARQQLKQKNKPQRRGVNGGGGGSNSGGRPSTAPPSGKQSVTSLKKGPNQGCDFMSPRAAMGSAPLALHWKCAAHCAGCFTLVLRVARRMSSLRPASLLIAPNIPTVFAKADLGL